MAHSWLKFEGSALAEQWECLLRLKLHELVERQQPVEVSQHGRSLESLKRSVFAKKKEIALLVEISAKRLRHPVPAAGPRFPVPCVLPHQVPAISKIF